MLETTFQQYTFEYLMAQALSNVPSTVDKRQGSIVYDSLAPACYELAKMYMNMQSALNKWDVENLSGDELELFINQRTALVRKPGVKATGTLTITGVASTVIPLGSRFGTTEVNYVTTEEKTIGVGGTVDVLIECEEEGVIGNCDVGDINKVVTSLLGVYNVSNNEEFITGYDEEPDDELLNRYFDKLQRPGKAGNSYHYEEWAKAVAGVGDAKVYPAWDGPLTVKVVVIDSNKRAADPTLIDAVEASIEIERPFGATVTVISAVEKDINISATLTILDQYSKPAVIDIITAKIVDYLKSAAFTTDFVSYAKIGGLIIETEGVVDYANLLLNTAAANVTLLDDEIPVIGTVSIV